VTSFSISVPIGAWHPLLPDTFASLLCQDGECEIAVLDASGDDRVGELIERHRDDLAYVRRGPDGGQSDAILEGWANTGGSILGWLNADDALLPGALAHVSGAFEARPELDVLYGHSVICDGDGALTGYHWAVEPPSQALTVGCIISQPSCFFRRSAHDAVGGLDRDLHYTMDWDLWLRLWRAGRVFDFSDQVYSRVLWGDDTKSARFNRARRNELNRLISSNPRLVHRINSRLGFTIHHMLSQPAFQRFAPLAERFFAPDRQPIHGLGTHGEIHGEAALPVFHFGEGPAGGAMVELKAVAERPVVARSVGTRIEIPPGEVSAWLPFGGSLPAGEAVCLTLESASDDPHATLSRVKLEPEA
jgi:GT2 family glycosyltransferase